MRRPNSTGYDNKITITGSGADTINAGQGDALLMLGDGRDTVTLAGSGNVVTVGSGADTIIAGSGLDSVTAGAGNDTVTLAGWTNTVSLGAGSDTVNAASGDTIAIDGTMLGLKGGKMEIVTVGSAGGSLTDQSSGTEVKIGLGSASLSLTGITADKGFLLDLLGGVGGYTTYAALAKAFTSDGHGGTALTLGAGGDAAMIDFFNTPQRALTAAMFRFN
jgi:Ca2+-binding RTX toxin-like protein